MNLFVLKYCLLVGAILTSTALVGGPLNPQKLFSSQSSSTPDGTQITADSVYQFGSDVFYKELDKPGNEYMKAGVEGYSKDLVPTQQLETQYNDQWSQGVASFESGFQGASQAYYELAGVPTMTSTKEKDAVCNEFHTANAELQTAEDHFTAAKASSTVSSADGFTIGMVLARVDPIKQSSEDAEISCMKAILADRDNDKTEFTTDLTTVGADVKEMNRIYPELKVLSNDFT